jgi:hypothetical protein
MGDVGRQSAGGRNSADGDRLARSGCERVALALKHAGVGVWSGPLAGLGAWATMFKQVGPFK